MSRKDYILIAEAIITMIRTKTIKKLGIKSAIATMCILLKGDNYSFDSDRFEKYIMERI